MYLTAEVHTASLFPAESKCSKPDSLAIWRMSKSYPKQLLKMYLINSYLNHSVNIGVLKTPDALQLVSLPICNWTFTITHTESIFMPREKAIHGVCLLYHKYDCVNHFLPNFPVWSTFFLADKPYNLQKIEIDQRLRIPYEANAMDLEKMCSRPEWGLFKDNQVGCEEWRDGWSRCVKTQPLIRGGGGGVTQWWPELQVQVPWGEEGIWLIKN